MQIAKPKANKRLRSLQLESLWAIISELGFRFQHFFFLSFAIYILCMIYLLCKQHIQSICKFSPWKCSIRQLAAAVRENDQVASIQWIIWLMRLPNVKPYSYHFGLWWNMLTLTILVMFFVNNVWCVWFIIVSKIQRRYAHWTHMYI